jgi:hypothetical protein
MGARLWEVAGQGKIVCYEETGCITVNKIASAFEINAINLIKKT